MKKSSVKKDILRGMRDGIPIALGYLAVGFSLGIIARNAGVRPFEGFVASFFTLASAGEYAVFTLIGIQASYIETAVMTLVANARYLLMNCAINQRYKSDEKFINKIGVSVLCTDEIFGINIARPGHISPPYAYGAGFVAVPGWSIGTALGIVAGNLLPAIVVSALSVALYGMFLAIIIPPARKSRIILGLVIIGFALSFVCSVLPGISALSEGTRTIILTVVISAAAAVIFPVNENGEEEQDA